MRIATACTFFLILPLLLCAQGEKGAARVATAEESRAGTTRAVIVGISEYQDPGITDLRFAHRDAVLFADFLQTPSGGQLRQSQFRLLINEQATMAAIQSALTWLLTNSEKGDRAIIYFSGHGDVEIRDDREKGYLLTYDTPKNNYRLNAIDIQEMNEQIIGKLSRRGARTIVLMDACHSGTLAGEGIGGREATASELMKRFASEVKIMSCQPYELSLESKDWGEGRGVFSYYLIEGLKGRADEDGDLRVNLYELDGFLQRRIRTATEKRQHPEVFGGRKEEAIFSTDEATLADVRARGQADLEQDLEYRVLYTLASPEGVANYRKFNEALATGQLMGPDGSAALACYRLLYADTTLMPLRSLIDERFCTALLDSAQQAIAAYLSADPQELASRDRFDRRYARFSEYLRQAAEILGPRDSRYRPVQARQHYFEGLAMRLESEQQGGNDSLYRLALEKQHLALALEDRAAYIHNEAGLLNLELNEVDSGMQHLRTAMGLSPTWAIPYNNLAAAYKQIDSLSVAETLYRTAIGLKPDLASAYTNLGNLFAAQEQPDSAEYFYTKALELNPANKENYFYLGLLLSGLENRQPEAETWYSRALEIDPDYPEVYFELGNLFDALSQPEKGEVYYKKALGLAPNHANTYLNLGILYYNTGRLEEAEQMFRQVIRLEPEEMAAYASLIRLYQNDWNKTAPLLLNAPLETAAKMALLHESGFALLQAKSYQQAQAVLLAAVNLDGTDPWSYYLLCTAYALQGKEGKALKYLTKTLETAGDAAADYAELIRTDENLNALRAHKNYIRLVQRFFPESQD